MLHGDSMFQPESIIVHTTMELHKERQWQLGRLRVHSNTEGGK